MRGERREALWADVLARSLGRTALSILLRPIPTLFAAANLSSIVFWILPIGEPSLGRNWIASHEQFNAREARPSLYALWMIEDFWPARPLELRARLDCTTITRHYRELTVHGTPRWGIPGASPVCPQPVNGGPELHQISKD